MVDWATSAWVQVISIALAGFVAYYKGRRIVLWGFLGFFLGPLALVLLFFRRKLPRKEYAILDSVVQRWVSRGIAKEFEGLGTPGDFLREIDKEQGGSSPDKKNLNEKNPDEKNPDEKNPNEKNPDEKKT